MVKMRKDTSIRVLKKDKKLLDRVRRAIYKTDSVPYTEVIRKLANNFMSETDAEVQHNEKKKGK